MSLGVAAAGMSRQPSDAIETFLHSPAFHRGATYRLLRTDDKRVSLYDLIRAGVSKKTIDKLRPAPTEPTGKSTSK